MENGAFAVFSIIFLKVFKTLLKFSLLHKNRKVCIDLKIAYGVKGLNHDRTTCYIYI